MRGQFNYLVTGAGRDIGQSIAVALAQNGSFAILHFSSNSDGVDKTIAEIQEKGGDGIRIQADFRNPEESQPLSESAKSALNGRGLDALIELA